MKHYGAFKTLRPFAALLLPACLAASPTFANSVIAGGYVPAIRNVSIAPISGNDPIRTDGWVEVAILEIDNNTPEYALVLDFAGKSGTLPDISEVRLEALGGTLGTGLDAAASAALRPDPMTGRFIWNPGIQTTATLGYRVRVLAAFDSFPADPPLMMVGMPASY